MHMSFFDVVDHFETIFDSALYSTFSQEPPPRKPPCQNVQFDVDVSSISGALHDKIMNNSIRKSMDLESDSPAGRGRAMEFIVFL